MSSLVDTSPARSGLQLWIRRVAVTLALFATVGVVVWAGLSLAKRPAEPMSQVARIALLPDTPPPPPPPPPPEEKPKIEPKNEIKEIDRPKPEMPAPEPLKMEGQAGTGPSPFAAGAVKNDYIGGDIGDGSRFSAYVARLAGIIQGELERRKLRVESAKLYLWLKPDGSVQRYEIAGASGAGAQDLRVAMANLERLPEAPPLDMPMPVGLDISER